MLPTAQELMNDLSDRSGDSDGTAYKRKGSREKLHELLDMMEREVSTNEVVKS